MITSEDIQIGMNEFERAGGNERRVRLSRRAGDLLSVLLNTWIYEGGSDNRNTTVTNRQHLAIEFVYRELPRLVVQLPAELALNGEVVSGIDIIHWIIPQWPVLLRGSEALGFIFDKE